MKLSVLIPNYNGETILPIFLPSVLKAFKAYQGQAELIIVDDCSKDESMQVLKDLCGDLARIEKNPQNLGFSGTCNRAASMAKGEILFFLNTDVELPETFFSTFHEYFTKPDTFAVTIHGIQYRTRENLDGVKIGEWKRGSLRVTRNKYPETFQMWEPSFMVQGAYFFVDRKKFEALGGFDERFNPFIFEETDLCYRALKRGWKIYFDSRAKGFHDHSTTLKSVASQKRLNFFSHRNRFLFIWKNISDPWLLTSHILFTLLRLPSVYSPLMAALKMWPSIRESRRLERIHWVRRDRELF